MFTARIILIYLFSVLYVMAYGQQKTVSGTVVDASSGKPLPNTTIIIPDDYLKTVTNEKGFFQIPVSQDSVVIRIQRMAYKNIEIKAGQISKPIALHKESYKLKEVTVSSEEATTLQNATVISETALSYLQASGLQDVFQLLPGNLSQNPDLSKFNQPLVREIDYNPTSSLGTALIIDGNQISSNAKMQTLSTLIYHPTKINDLTLSEPFGKGNDLRALSADNIESIKIIRGIPSVQYGDLTNAVIEINSKIYVDETSLKLKYNPNLFSTGIYHGRNISNRLTLSGNANYISNSYDERLPLSSYKRMNYSLGTRYSLNNFSYIKTIFSGFFTLNKNRNDIDALADKEVFEENNTSLRSTFSYTYLNNSSLIKSIFAKLNFNIDKAYTFYKKYSSFNDVTPYTSTYTEGENIGSYTGINKLNEYSIRGIPLTINLKSNFTINKTISELSTNTLFGFESRYEKNLGHGLEFDPINPPLITSNSIREQPFNELPALFSNAFFLEEKLNKSFNKHKIEAQLGMRHSLYSMGNLSFNFLFEPRLNGKYTFNISRSSAISLHGGYGIHYKLPVMRYLYPDNAWFDMISYNYYNTEDPSHSLLIFTSEKITTQNKNIKPNKSEKSELGIHFNNKQMHATLTAFIEKHNDGIQLNHNYYNSSYKVYNGDLINDFAGLPLEQYAYYEIKNQYNDYLYPVNTISTTKKGLEYSLKTAKVIPLQTKVILTGAWFHTKIINNQDTYYFLPPSNTSEQNDYIGIYSGGYGKLSERLSSNLQLITHIPNISMVFSVSFQTVWFYKYRFIRVANAPTALIDREGIEIPFTETMMMDPEFGSYIQTQIEDRYQTEVFPPTTQINLKLSKELWDHFKISFFANNIFNTRPLILQKISNTFIRMNSPLYFGLDLNINL